MTLIKFSKWIFLLCLYLEIEVEKETTKQQKKNDASKIVCN